MASNKCLNCSTKNEADFQYCNNCGQKNTDGKITFSELWSEFQDAVFNIESRTWITLKNLFIPGKLTLEYFEGKHKKYVHPLRLLLVSSILVILAMSFQNFHSFTNHSYNIKDRILKNYERKQAYRITKNIADTTKTIFLDQQSEIVADTMVAMLRDSLNDLLTQYTNKYGDTYEDSINLNEYASFGSQKMELVSKYDFLNKEEDELVELYKKDASSLSRHIFKQKISVIKDESKHTAAIIGNATWAILLMMPCLALILYILYLRHNYYYIEHLIFSFHFHAFLFLILAVLILGFYTFPLWLFKLSLILTWIYVFISMWKVYKQSLFKTIIKFTIFSIAYFSLFLLFLVGTVLSTFYLH